MSARPYRCLGGLLESTPRARRRRRLLSASGREISGARTPEFKQIQHIQTDDLKSVITPESFVTMVSQGGSGRAYSHNNLKSVYAVPG
jgi:hypothetical protein